MKKVLSFIIAAVSAATLSEIMGTVLQICFLKKQMFPKS